MAFARKWSIQTELMPRNLFPGLSLPITFTLFTKDRACRLSGFFLYREADDVTQLRPEVRRLVAASVKAGSVWRQAVNVAFDRLGQERAPLGEIYAAIEHRPEKNRHCEQQVRKVLQTYPEFAAIERGVWSRSRPNAAVNADQVAQAA